MNQKTFLSILFFTLLISINSKEIKSSLKPVIFYHGLLGHYTDFDRMKELILKLHPDTKLFHIEKNTYLSSLFNPIKPQAETLITEIRNIKIRNNISSYQLVCVRYLYL
jgi:hypothetical protein